MTAPLYNQELLALAVGNAEFPRLTTPDYQVERRAPLCGSRIWIDLETDAAGCIARLGMKVEACVIGQAAASVMARAAIGKSDRQMAAAEAAIAAWLTGDAALPDWPGFAALAPARDYPARHGAILLPFSAANAAMTTAATERAP